MSTAPSGRVGRSYTQARRFPWVLGRIGDWTLPVGPYTPAQLVVGVGGAYVLIKTFAWWSFLGPVPVVAWGAAIWAVRGARIGGRTPGAAAVGVVEFALQPSGGRIRGRAVRMPHGHLLYGGVTIDEVPGATADHRRGGSSRAKVPRLRRSSGKRHVLQRSRASTQLPTRPVRPRPGPAPTPTPLQALLRRDGEGGL